MKIFLKVLVLFLAFSSYLLAQQTTDTINIDTTITDTTLIDIIITDTITDTSNTELKQDTIIYYPFSNHRGSIFYCNDNINHKEIPTNHYYFTTELITKTFPANPLFTTITGNHSAFSIFGSLPTENICMLSGVAINDFYGSANLNYISPEFANNIEILYGSSAAIKTGKSGMAVNIQPFIYNTSKPYSKIWYSQGDNKLIGVDGIYSQNFMPNWNITGGFKRISSNSYYQNSFVDMWNARLMLSFQQSEQSAFSLLYHFTNFYTGDFGGIFFTDYNQNNNAPNQVRPNFATLTDRQYNTNLIFSHSYHSQDSNLIINSNLFLNHLENNINYGKDTLFIRSFGDSTGRNIASNFNYGLNTNLKYNLSDLVSINSGVEVSSNNVPKTLITKEFTGIGFNIYTMGIFNFDATNISLGGRYGQHYDKNIFSLGSSISKNITEKTSAIADVSYLKIEPIPIFDYQQEAHLLTIFGLNYDSIFAFNLFYRNITDQIILTDKSNLHSFSTIKDNSLFGGTIKSNIKLPHNFRTILLLSNYIDKNADNSNTLYANLSLEYTYIKNQSLMTFGLNGTLLQANNKYYFSPLVKNYVRTELNEGLEFDGLSAYIKARLGNCYLRISFNNILGLNYSYLAYYPMLKQEFCLSLTWAFPY